MSMTSADYAAANRLWRRHRTAMTRAENQARKANTVEAWRAVLALVTDQTAEWDALGWPWPDDWSRWQRLSHDAANALQRLP